MYFFYYNVNSEVKELHTEQENAEKIIKNIVCEGTTRQKIEISPVTHVQKTSDGGFYVVSPTVIGKTTSLGVLEWKYAVANGEKTTPLILENGENTYAVLKIGVKERVIILDKAGKELKKVELEEQFSRNTQILQAENKIILMGVLSSMSNTTSLLVLSTQLEIQSQFLAELTIINRAHYDINSGSLFLSGQTYKDNLSYFCLLQLGNDFH